MSIPEINREFNEKIAHFNKKNNQSTDAFAERILINEKTRSLEARKYVVSRITDPNAREILNYMLGITKIVPDQVSQEIKLKYTLLHMMSSLSGWDIEEIMSSFNTIPEKDKPNAVEKLLELLDGKKISSGNINNFSELLRLLGKGPFEKRFQDFKLLMNFITFSNVDGLISLLIQALKLENEAWAKVVDRMCLVAKILDSSFDAHIVEEWSGYFIESSRMENGEWLQLLKEASELVGKMDGKICLYSILQAMIALEDVPTTIDKSQLLETLSQFKGLGECISFLIPEFLKISPEEWSEIIQPSQILACESSCDTMYVVKALIKARAGERMNVAVRTKVFVEELHKEKIYGSEIGHLVCAAGEIDQDIRYEVMVDALQHYQNAKSEGTELNGVELAEEIRRKGALCQ